MQDFTFGSLSTIEKRLARLRLQRAGVLHLHQTTPLDPRPNQAVTIHALTGPDRPVDQMTLYYTLDGSEPQGNRGVAEVGVALPMQPVSVEWDLIDWGYATRWQTVLPPQPDGVKLTYKIGAWVGRGQGEVFADNQAVSSQVATRFALAYDTHQVPDWVWDAQLYFIFLDRFAPSPGRSFKDNGTARGFSGGTLRGVIDKLGYIADLGANCLWMTPCFEGTAYHGYHTTDYLKVDPRWGSNQDLIDLTRHAHDLGIRVLLDFVPNHTARHHPFFKAAQSDPTSPYVGWYTFNRWPDDYLMFYNVKDLPKVDLEHAAARQHMLDAAHFWLEAAGVDGFRLDHAAGPSHNFWTDFRRATRTAAPDSFTVGEVVDDADFLRSYTGRLDGVLDFLFLDAVRRFFAFDTLDAAGFDAFLTRHGQYFGPGIARPSFLDNHDMNRFLFTVGDDKARLRLAALCMFTLPQPPVLYYGTEVGMSQERDKRDRTGQGDAETRRPMWWDDRQDRELYAYFRRLFHLRREHIALRRGQRVPLLVDGASGVLAYAMTHPDETVIIVLNNSAATREVLLPLSMIKGWDVGLNLVDGLTGQTVEIQHGQAYLRLPPRGGSVLIR